MEARRRVQEILAGVLPHGADLVILDEEGNRVVVEIKTGPRFEVQWLARGWPRQVREALEGGRPDVMMAPEMSPGARALAEEAEVGWADERGAASFVVDSVIVSREPRRPRPPERKRPSWTSSTLAVVEALLTGTRATVAEVTERTELSNGTASKVLRLLTDAGFLAAAARRGRHSGRWLEDPAGLLDAYAEAAERLRSDLVVQAGIDAGDPVTEVIEVGRRWTRESRCWAATGALAAHFQAPYLQRPAPLEIYLDVTSLTGLEGAARDAGLLVVRGGRLTLRPFPSRATARMSEVETTRDGECRCVPWPRTFADLRVGGVRGEEAADHLRDLHLPRAGEPDV